MLVRSMASMASSGMMLMTLPVLASLTKLRLIDHHKTTAGFLKDKPYAIHDVTKSGCRLSWEYFHGNDLPPSIVEYTEDYDLYKFNLPNSRIISCAINSLPFNFKSWYDVMNDVDKLENDGTAVQQFIDKQKAITKTIVKSSVFCGLKTKHVNCNLTSVCNQLAEELLADEDCDLFVHWYRNPDGKYIYGLRSNPNVDCAAIAKSHNGGGHTTAAGFVSDYYWL